MTKTAIIDLAAYDPTEACNKGYELELTDPNPKSGKPLGVFITVVGSESDAFKDHVRSRANNSLREQFAAQRKGKQEPPTVDRAVEEAVRLLAACTVSWRTGDRPVIEWAGEQLECCEANARRLYAHKWIRDQVDDAVGDLGNFMPG